MKKLLLLILLLIPTLAAVNAQVVTTEPSPLQTDSKNVVIYFHADLGDRGLVDQAPNTAIYAHTGVITSESSSPSDWKHAPNWNQNLDKYKLEFVRPNLWKLNIGSIDEFYGIKAGETVQKLAFVFRNSNGTKTGRAEGGGDIFVDVLPPGLQIALTSNPAAGMLRPGVNKVSLSAQASRAAKITISLNGTDIASEANGISLSTDYTFTQFGNYTFTATAAADGETASASLEFVYPKPSPEAVYPGGVPKMGAVRGDDGSVTFCLAAPQKSSAILVGSWNDYNASTDQTMNYQDYQGVRYFWLSIPGLAADKPYMYYYSVDGSYNVGDPYARLVLDPSNDKYIPESVYPDLPAYPEKLNGLNIPLAVYQENINDYDWEVKDFRGVEPSDLIIYELLVRDFTGTEGKALGNGTIRGAMAKINYLKSLGINAVELLPINEFNGNISWGYNPNFYFAPDKAYGTPDDYKAFIDACHKEGIAVILDIVFNQTDWLHPWYQLYAVGENPFFNADAPHAYSVLNDWNQGNPLVQQQFKDALKYWLKEYKVDGFRFDLVKGLGDNDSYANSGDAATNAYNASRVANMRALQQAMNEVNPRAYFINENLAGAKEENEMAETGQINWANYNNQGCQYAAGEQSNSALNGMLATNTGRTWGSTVSYLESHDEQRLAYVQDTRGVQGVKGNVKASMQRLGSAAAQMILTPGAHMIWQFSEMGNAQNTKNSNGGNNVDPKIVNWGLLDQEDHAGLRQSYSELCHIRKLNPELFTESASFNIKAGANDWAYGRFLHSWTGDKEVICAINPSPSESRTISVPFNTRDNSAYMILSQSYASNPQYNAVAGTVTLEPNCYLVLGTTQLAGVEEIGADADADAPVEVYNLQGIKVASGTEDLPAGIYIVKQGAKTSKRIIK